MQCYDNIICKEESPRFTKFYPDTRCVEYGAQFRFSFFIFHTLGLKNENRLKRQWLQSILALKFKQNTGAAATFKNHHLLFPPLLLALRTDKRE